MSKPLMTTQSGRAIVCALTRHVGDAIYLPVDESHKGIDCAMVRQFASLLAPLAEQLAPPVPDWMPQTYPLMVRVPYQAALAYLHARGEFEAAVQLVEAMGADTGVAVLSVTDSGAYAVESKADSDNLMSMVLGLAHTGSVVSEGGLLVGDIEGRTIALQMAQGSVIVAGDLMVRGDLAVFGPLYVGGSLTVTGTCTLTLGGAVGGQVCVDTLHVSTGKLFCLDARVGAYIKDSESRVVTEQQLKPDSMSIRVEGTDTVH